MPNNSKLKLNNSGSGEILVQAGILAAASIVVRIIGLLYQAPLTAIIGDEGNGYYSYAYNIYTIILLISSYSIPSAISKIMAQKLALGQYRSTQRIFRVSLFYVCVVGAAAGLFMYFGAGILVKSSSVPVLRVFAPTIFLFGLLGVLRGYFQAHSSMVQTSISQIIEQIVNASMSIFAAWMLMRSVSGQSRTTQAVYGAAGSALGTGCGVLAALLFMTWVYHLNRSVIAEHVRMDTVSEEVSDRKILKEVIRVVTPFILSSFILNLTTSLNQTIYSSVMMDVKGLEQSVVTLQYGIFSRKPTVITNIPISIATAASAAIIPNISSAFATGDHHETLRRARHAVWLTAIVAIPSTVGLIVLARPVTLLLYPQMTSLPEASKLLMALAVTVFFYSLSTVTNAILQATDHMNLPLVSAVIALAVQTAALVFMLNRTTWDTYALVLASILYSVMIFISNELFLRRYLGPQINLGRKYVVPVIAAIGMGAGAFAVYQVIYQLLTRAAGMGADGSVKGIYFANLIALLPAMIAAVFIYFRLLLRLHAVSEDELLHLPKGAKIMRVLKKLRWI
jgi:stage V sporulation protein B